MKIEDVVAQMQRVDKALRAGKAAEPSEMQISIGRLYNDCLWGGPEATALPPEALKELQVEDMTADSRWSKHFINHPTHLGLYRTRVGYYWLLSYDALRRDHVLQHAGAAGEAAKTYGA
jgi:hypothetical protein